MFVPSWEVRNDKNGSVERFWKLRSAQYYTEDMNNPELYSENTYNGAFYWINSRF